MLDDALRRLEAENPKIIMFCGKGGVGKTTCASATAIHFARRGKRTLLISTDPAPSLSDILEVDADGDVTPVPGVCNLHAVELNYDKVIDLWKERYGQEVYEVIASFLPVDEDIIEYVAGAPGIDEEFALSYVHDLYTCGDYDVIVWDTAPAGGTLSLLHLQETFYSHMRDAARLYIRLKDALSSLTGKERRDPLRIIGAWEQLAKDVLSMVRSRETVAFIVTIPEHLGVAQTRRIEKELARFGVQVGGVIVNYYLSDEASRDSALYRSRRDVHLKYMGVLEETYRDRLPLVKLPLQYFEVKGVEALGRVEKQLFC
jgi:arsenite-transporting ATPase